MIGYLKLFMYLSCNETFPHIKKNLYKVKFQNMNEKVKHFAKVKPILIALLKHYITVLK